MLKSIFLITLFSLPYLCWTQSIDGHYTAYELNGLSIDTSGNINFYGINSFPAKKFYYEVSIIITGKSIIVDKVPITFEDSIKMYSTSDGGFIKYKGKIKKYGDRYFAKTTMIDYDYLGLSFFESPKRNVGIDTSENLNLKVDTSNFEIERSNINLYDRIERNGKYVYFSKGTLQKDFIIRKDKDGIWINNLYYRRVRK